MRAAAVALLMIATSACAQMPEAQQRKQMADAMRGPCVAGLEADVFGRQLQPKERDTICECASAYFSERVDPSQAVDWLRSGDMTPLTPLAEAAIKACATSIRRP